MDRLKTTELLEAKQFLLEEQDYICALCGIDMSEFDSKNIHLDHSHSTGQIRAVLCSNCNRSEGSIVHFANRSKREGTILEWLKGLIEYIEYHEQNPSGIFHSKYRTEDEKRLARNKKARIRAKKKRESLK